MQTKDTLTLKTGVPTKFDNSTTMILYTGALDVLKNLELFPSETFWQKEYPIKQKPIVYKNNYV